jgi:predicted DNA-binding protein with PD1-like motif
MQIIVKRLLPNQDIKESLISFLEENQLSAAAIISAVGSVKVYVIRVSDGSSVISGNENREIVSLSGILTKDGIHVHLTLSGLDGCVIGGHLMEGCLVNTTLEVVLMSLEDDLTREFDSDTGYKELVIKKRAQ